MQKPLTCLLVALLLSTGCSQETPPVVTPSQSPSPVAESPSPSPSPSIAADPNSSVGKTDETGTVIKVDTPSNSECHSKFQADVTMKLFENCLIPDMTYVQVANVFGNKGSLSSESGGYTIRQWRGGDGQSVTVSFQDNYLSSKTQIGLE